MIQKQSRVICREIKKMTWGGGDKGGGGYMGSDCGDKSHDCNNRMRMIVVLGIWGCKRVFGLGIKQRKFTVACQSYYSCDFVIRVMF